MQKTNGRNLKMSEEKMIKAYIATVNALGFTVTEPEYEEGDYERVLFIGKKIFKMIPGLVKETVPVLRIYLNRPVGIETLIDSRASYINQDGLLKDAQLFIETARFLNGYEKQKS